MFFRLFSIQDRKIRRGGLRTSLFRAGPCHGQKFTDQLYAQGIFFSALSLQSLRTTAF
jgi:hypothetical protein